MLIKRALITGITGQDGSYLAEFLLKKGYEVHGIKRRASSFNTQRIDHIYENPHINHNKFKLHYGDLTDSSNLTRIIQEVEPDEVYNLGAQSHVAVSFEAPEYTADVVANGTLRLLEAIRFLGLETKTRFYQASTSGIILEFSGKGIDEIATVAEIKGDDALALKVGDVIIRIDPRYFRPAEVETLLGNPAKAKEKLGWEPEITVQEMCSEMIATDLKYAKRNAFLKEKNMDTLVSSNGEPDEDLCCRPSRHGWQFNPSPTEKTPTVRS